MFKHLLAAATLAVLATAALAEVETGIGKDFKHSAPMGSPHQPGKTGNMPFAAPEGPVSTATVVQAIDGAGYTYLELEKDGQRFWVAGTQVKVSQGDQVEYIENVVMENFSSRTLNRSFDRIIFASSVKKAE